MGADRKGPSNTGITGMRLELRRALVARAAQPPAPMPRRSSTKANVSGKRTVKKKDPAETHRPVAAAAAAPEPDGLVPERDEDVAGAPVAGGDREGPQESAAGDGDAEELAQKLRAEVRSRNDAYLRRIGKVALILAALSPLVVYAGFALECEESRCSFVRIGAEPRNVVIATAVVALGLLLLALVMHGSGGLRSLLIGEDGRFSTSHTQVAIWTLAIVFSTIFLILQAPASNSVGSGDRPPDPFELDVTYLLLLGGPFAAAGLARAAVQRKTDDQTLQRTEADETTPTDVLKNDDGKGDLIDVQFLAFNLVALIYFMVAMAREPTGLPTMPWGLVGLTSLGAIAYTGAKFAAANAPTITSVTKREGEGRLRPGDEVIIRGANLVPAGAAKEEMVALLRVKFGSSEVAAIPVGLPDGNFARDRLRARIPIDAAPPTVDVVAVTAAGMESNGHTIAIDADVPVITGAASLPVKPGGELVLTGRYFTQAGTDGRATVSFGGIPRAATSTRANQITVGVPPTVAGDTVTVEVIADGSTAASESVVLPVTPPPTLRSAVFRRRQDGLEITASGEFGPAGWDRHVLQVNGSKVDVDVEGSRFTVRGKVPENVVQQRRGGRGPHTAEVRVLDAVGRASEPMNAAVPAADR